MISFETTMEEKRNQEKLPARTVLKQKPNSILTKNPSLVLSLQKKAFKSQRLVVSKNFECFVNKIEARCCSNIPNFHLKISK